MKLPNHPWQGHIRNCRSPKQPLQGHINDCRWCSQMVSLHLQDKMWTHPNSLCKITSVTAVNSHRWFYFVYKIQRELTPSAFARSHPWLPLVLTDDFTLLTGYHVNSPHQPLLGHISDCRRFSQMVSCHFLHVMWTNPISLCKVTSVTAVGSHRWLHSIFIFFFYSFILWW